MNQATVKTLVRRDMWKEVQDQIPFDWQNKITEQPGFRAIDSTIVAFSPTFYKLVDEVCQLPRHK